LETQSNLGDGTRGLYERSLAISIRSGGPDGENAAFGNNTIGIFHQKRAIKQSTVDAKRMHLLLAKSHHVEAQRITTLSETLRRLSYTDA
jgi:hypothetical protein